MTDPRQSAQDRVLELLADQAVFGLTAEETAELNGLLAASPVADIDELHRLAADLARSYLPSELASLPEHLHAAAIAAAPAHLAQPTPRHNFLRYRNIRYAAVGLGVAACLLVALGLWWNTRPAPSPTLAERRNELISRAKQPGSDVIRLDWTATADPAAKGASGDLVWSTKDQEGFMRFRGLAANSPTREQYQLWVFDAARDERYPVDGGVFDVPTDGEAIVPIRVKLGVSQPTLFAVTVEPPGGVVVSSRARLPLLARVPPKPG